jgi:hypothetical protein
MNLKLVVHTHIHPFSKSMIILRFNTIQILLASHPTRLEILPYYPWLQHLQNPLLSLHLQISTPHFPLFLSLIPKPANTFVDTNHTLLEIASF